MKKVLYVLVFILFVINCKQQNPPGWIDKDRLLNRQPQEWLSLGGNHLMQHFSPLGQINRDNVKDLGFAWEYDAHNTVSNVHRGLEATPIVVDGILYTSGAWGFVYAVDARNGREKWRYNPSVDASYARRVCCDVVNRGVAVWEGRVYVGTLDGYLACLDAKTGAEIWKKDSFTDRTRPYTITGPPQVAGNIVMIGNSGGELGVRGYITAYDLKSGEQKWRFFIVPGDPKKNDPEHIEVGLAAKTWDPNSFWEAGGGGTSWGESAYDPELNLLYVGTGNSTPYPIWYRSPNGGDNLYLCSILAINPDNGKLVWHYQTTPGEIWDYTSTMNIVLADIEMSGTQRKVLMQAPKNGFFYVLDRATGELLSAEKYTRVNWASHVDLKTGKPVKTEQGWYKDEPKLVMPTLSGGHNWQPMSFNPLTGLVYIPEHNNPMVYKHAEQSEWKPDQNNTALDYGFLGNFKSIMQQVKDSTDTISSESLLAWNPVTQKAVWKVTDGAPDGGILSTAGLIFQGTRTGYLKVYDAYTGEKLKEIFTGTGIMAAPVSYSLDGEQYISVMAGYGGVPMCCYPDDAAFHQYENLGRILTFKLGGVATPLPPLAKVIPTPAPPAVKIKLELVSKGLSLYYGYCNTCHGAIGGHSSQHPDLTKLPESKHKLFKEIVIDGLLAQSGMASFSNTLSVEDVEAIHVFLLDVQTRTYEKENPEVVLNRNAN
ncbi:MAG TPA: PQQ-dependent dehydrogenase, methanol/ethanol family [Chryseolinea sp.]|nr:PQQ-dependent dehydrogenase, methanol/ethanol family [Chryseolinea sp.]